MTERISIFNYEAFYLDFLEGNLSEADTALLMEFFKKHPELQMEDEELIVLPSEEASVTSFKEELKQVDVSSDSINAGNLDTFLIADVEGQLSKEKTAELSTFIIKNEFAQVEKRRVLATKLTPDLTQTFEDKKSLKKNTRVVPMWSYVAAAAAVFLVFFSTGIFNNSTLEPGTLYTWLDEDPSIIINQLPATSSNNVAVTNVAVNGTEPAANKRTQEQFKKRVFQSKKSKEGIGLMAIRKDFSISNNQVVEDVKPMEQIVIAQTTNQQVNQPKEVAKVEMKNPIKPITNRLSEVTKTDIDFKTTAKSDTKNSGFLFKIGKVEVSRTTSK